jgi:hypothetical protein
MLKFTFNSKREAIESLINGNGELLERGKAGKFVVCGQPLTDRLTLPQAPKVINERRVARALREFAFVTPEYLRGESDFQRPNAFAFAKVFLSVLRPGELPIVFQTIFDAIIGRKALALLQEVPDRLQYLGRWTAKDVRGSKHLGQVARAACCECRI